MIIKTSGMNTKREQFDFSKQEEQERFSALAEEERTKVINQQQGEANLLDRRMGSNLSRQLVSAQIYASLGNIEDAKKVFVQMAEKRKEVIESYDQRVKSILTDIAAHLAQGAPTSYSYRVGIKDFNVADIESVAAFLEREVIKNVSYYAVELGSSGGRTYFLREKYGTVAGNQNRFDRIF